MFSIMPEHHQPWWPVQREGKRQTFGQDTLRAREDYPVTGLHATADDVAG
ncbi:hypothetical protein [Vreelandella rituensis]|nr:hypothetical protein [Halomonas rituensis]